MNEYIDIVGKRIKMSDIKNFEIRKCEYIYRPSFQETKKIFGKKYEFSGMKPFAAVCDESSHNSALSTIGDKFNIKAFKSKKYKCITPAGRQIETYLEDVPAVITKIDGQIYDVYKSDILYKSLGKVTAPSISVIEALFVSEKKDYWFYSNGIDFENDEMIEAQYKNLLTMMNLYESESKKTSKNLNIPVINKIGLPFRKK